MSRIIALLLATAACAAAETTVLKNFTLIDGNGGEPVRRASMVIVDGRIQSVGPAARVRGFIDLYVSAIRSGLYFKTVAATFIKLSTF